MTVYPKGPPRALSDSHRRILFEESGIDPAVAEERGYRTVKRRAGLEEFPEWQRRLGLYIPTYSPDGETTGCQIRPNRSRKPELKYESPQGSRVILDAHPRTCQEVRSGDGNLFVVEGTKKADALVSRGAATVALTGVWMAHVPKSKPKRLLPCWDHVRLVGRRVFIVFDSDWRRKDTVHDALEWLVGALEDRGADVRVAYLEDDPDGSKVGRTTT
jgi:putative DNA primase/helicase